MSLCYAVLNEGTFVYAVAGGVLTETDLIQHERTVLTDPRVVRGFRQLLDCRAARSDTLRTELLLAGLEEVRARGAGKLHGARYAVVGHNAWWFDARLQERWEAPGMTIIAFNDPSTACVWLGIDYRALTRVEEMQTCVPPHAALRWDVLPVCLSVPQV